MSQVDSQLHYEWLQKRDLLIQQNRRGTLVVLYMCTVTCIEIGIARKRCIHVIFMVSCAQDYHIMGHMCVNLVYRDYERQKERERERYALYVHSVLVHIYMCVCVYTYNFTLQML